MWPLARESGTNREPSGAKRVTRANADVDVDANRPAGTSFGAGADEAFRLGVARQLPPQLANELSLGLAGPAR